MSYKVTTVSKEAVKFGEGPIWDTRRKKLTFVDLFDKSVGILDPKSQVISQKTIPDLESALMLSVAIPCANSTDNPTTENPNFLVAAAGKLIKYNWDTETSNVLFDYGNNEAEQRNVSLGFNDGKCDVKGRLWIGSFVLSKTMTFEPNAGAFHKFENVDGCLKETIHAREYNVPNGLAWNKQNTILHHVDYGKNTINVYDFDSENGTLANPRVFFDFKQFKDIKGEPDGMVTDESGNLWVACWKGGCVIKIDGITGQLLTTINLPVDNTTSLCFGGDNFESLFVTTTSLEGDTSRSPVKGQPDAGKIFCVTEPKDNSFKGFEHYYANI